MAKLVTGTFSGTGSSDPIQANELAIDLTFAGTATVAVQWRLDGSNWRDVEEFTASTTKLYGPGPTAEWRLNCSAHTNDVTYTMRS